MQKIIALSQQLLKSILAALWEIFKSGLWLIVQVIELAAWAVSALSKKLARMQRMVKVTLKRNKMALITWPFKQLLLGIWAVIVAAFWLLIQTIELFVWVLSRLRQPFSPKTSPAREELEKVPLPPSVELRRRAMSELGSGARKNKTPAVVENPANEPTPPPAVESRRQRLKTARGKVGLIVALILLLPSVLFAIAAFPPAVLNFQGNLLVEGTSFTYTGSNSNKLFLNSIRGLKQLELEGTQQITLTGKFQSQSDPAFSSLTKLTVQLPNRSSKLILEPAKPQQSQLELVELRLQPNTKVTRLSYNPDGQKLAVSLQPDRAQPPNTLKLSLGKQPLKITLEDYRLPDGKLKDSKIPNLAEFTFTPALAEVNLGLQHATALSLSLPAAEPTVSNQWIWGYLDVQAVKFHRTRPTYNSNESNFESTIIQGKVQMAGQQLNLASDRFFLPGKPGIQRIGNLQIHSEEPQGLAVSIQGKAETVAVGTDINSPVNPIQGKFLNRYLPHYAIAALLAFWAAALCSLLLRFFNQLPKKS